MRASPAGRLYGESLANALAVYLLTRYSVQRYTPVPYRGGLPGYRLKRVLAHIGDNFAEDLSLSQLAAVAGMTPHYFAELFKTSTGYAPHKYVLLQRIERAKQKLGIVGIASSRWLSMSAFRIRAISPALSVSLWAQVRRISKIRNESGRARWRSRFGITVPLPLSGRADELIE